MVLIRQAAMCPLLRVFLHAGKEPTWDKKLTIVSTTFIHAEYPSLSFVGSPEWQRPSNTFSEQRWNDVEIIVQICWFRHPDAEHMAP
jgi:hypothetical protein